MEATASQVTDMIGKWLLLEAQYRDAQYNLNNEHSLYSFEERSEMLIRATDKQSDFENAVTNIFGKKTLDVVRHKGGEMLKAIVKGA